MRLPAVKVTSVTSLDTDPEFLYCSRYQDGCRACHHFRRSILVQQNQGDRPEEREDYPGKAWQPVHKHIGGRKGRSGMKIIAIRHAKGNDLRGWRFHETLWIS